MLEVLTPLSKCHRVSRKIDAATFVAAPGIWAQVQADGSLVNVATGTPPPVAKLVIGNASANSYESHDVEVGRITTLEAPIGARVKVDSAGYTGSPSAGDALTVDETASSEGKLKTAASTDIVVANCEEVDATAGTITFSLASPTILA